ncbi:FAD-binding oxidoreductase [Kaistia nematophila]|uniref:FAD-binding oxidoreductase n=1 Tax=Kaistia nematophila TaxID=2994654 RepID=A0A9X3E626_9HYPH|nr:FAD-binding oxidoreductase [Kaistia nematophila]MCX5572234.1 FAD-binding oxidoreductase [Kaistia nematophila]
MGKAEAVLDETMLIRDVDRGSHYIRDWTGEADGDPSFVARPRNVDEVVELVRYCADNGLAVVPQGGHTGLVEGASARIEGGHVLVSLERMNRIRAIDPLNFSVEVEAGCVLEVLHQAVEAEDLMFPLSLGAKGSCQIGGNVATNAGGINVLRYGMMRDLVLGLEVVLPDGRVWNGLKTLRKDNTGYDLKQLFLGSEGTLGIVTAATLKLFPRPSHVETMFLAVETAAEAIRLFAAARRHLADLLSAFELISDRSVELALTMPDLVNPLEMAAPYYVLLEASSSGPLDLEALVGGFLEFALEEGMILDGVRASSVAQAQKIWAIREGVVEAQVKHGTYLRTDVSVPISEVAVCIDEVEVALAGAVADGVVLTYGHIGDGNMHFVVMPPLTMAEGPERHAWIKASEAVIFEIVDRRGGSISAEHGIGRVKRSAFEKRASATQMELLRAIRSAIDPDNRMNPGAIFE